MHGTWEVLFLKKYGSGELHGKKHMEKHHLTPKDQDAETGFRWSLTLVAKILVRTILEGATMGLEGTEW